MGSKDKGEVSKGMVTRGEETQRMGSMLYLRKAIRYVGKVLKHIVN